MKIPSEAARLLAACRQGLVEDTSSPPDTEDLGQLLSRLGYIQLDTINVVARSQYLVAWSRLGPHPMDALDRLHAEGKAFEWWAHGVSLIPREHFPYFRVAMLRQRHGKRYYDARWAKENAELLDQVLGVVGEKGEVTARDFAAPKGFKSSGWWHWKPAKRALDHLWNQGYLLVIRRDNFQKVYEIAERAYPGLEELDASLPSGEERLRFLVENALKAQGVATARDVGGYYHALRRRGADVAEQLRSLVRGGLALPVEVEGWTDTAYIHQDNYPSLEAILAGELVHTNTTILSPFDSLISDRQRTRRLFGFDYSLEAYIPAARRKYGYYTMPILHCSELVGRLDGKARRKAGTLTVRGLWFELETKLDDALLEGLAGALSSLRAFLGLGRIEWAEGVEPALGTALAGLVGG